MEYFEDNIQIREDTTNETYVKAYVVFCDTGSLKMAQDVINKESRSWRRTQALNKRLAPIFKMWRDSDRILGEEMSVLNNSFVRITVRQELLSRVGVVE
jgi:hypothetical protein